MSEERQTEPRRKTQKNPHAMCVEHPTLVRFTVKAPPPDHADAPKGERKGRPARPPEEPKPTGEQAPRREPPSPRGSHRLH